MYQIALWDESERARYGGCAGCCSIESGVKSATDTCGIGVVSAVLRRAGDVGVLHVEVLRAACE